MAIEGWLVHDEKILIVVDEGIAVDDTCCCGGCCGRKLPGVDSLEGDEYYPLTLNFNLSSIDCFCGGGAGGTMTWDPVDGRWEGSFAVVDCIEGTITVLCTTDEEGNDIWTLTLDIGMGCVPSPEASVPAIRTMTATLTAGECDPLDLSTASSIEFNGIGCCGEFPGQAHFDVEIFE